MISGNKAGQQLISLLIQMPCAERGVVAPPAGIKKGSKRILNTVFMAQVRLKLSAALAKIVKFSCQLAPCSGIEMLCELAAQFSGVVQMLFKGLPVLKRAAFTAVGEIFFLSYRHDRPGRRRLAAVC
jgi:hypothetical protein